MEKALLLFSTLAVVVTLAAATRTGPLAFARGGALLPRVLAKPPPSLRASGATAKRDMVCVAAARRWGEFGSTVDNSFVRELTPEARREDFSQFDVREVRRAHYTLVKPEPVRAPTMVAFSPECATLIGLDPAECSSEEFAAVMGGNAPVPGSASAWATVYGCSHAGTWFGQLGDGRAMSIAEVVPNPGERFELQLKGCGRTPFSRRFDGRAVLRSCIREFLQSEAMHHLGVGTTRALSVVASGDTVMRAWYRDTAEGREAGDGVDERDGGGNFAYPPNLPKQEQGAVMCRVAKSFIRFAQLELFWKREEYTQMVLLADHAILREYPHIASLPGPEHRKYVELFRSITESVAVLVAEWLRVGYIQGNMNSDNTAVGGVTIDYGPFGMLEKYHPTATPFTSDGDKKFSFSQQPRAMAINVAILAEAFKGLLAHQLEQEGGDGETLSKLQEEIGEIAQAGFVARFTETHRGNNAHKLGLLHCPETTELWASLMGLFAQSEVDFTVFFRTLAQLDTSAFPPLPPTFDPAWGADDANKGGPKGEAQAMLAGLPLAEALYALPSEEGARAWWSWLARYTKQARGEARGVERAEDMRGANPKYILRNWMAAQAYEAAEAGDYSMVNELQDVLSKPYEEQSPEVSEKYFRRTPEWADQMPGVAFMS
mmetsp:Transcript_48257/g.114829  ORF Transcript_48257/g.114829 Transcript_48257/m.114829 type:complete len:659 (-) Transcript_48257:175-2151(-)